MNAEKSVYYWDRPAREYVEKIYGITETIRVIERARRRNKKWDRVTIPFGAKGLSSDRPFGSMKTRV